ncbi:sugar transferase [Arenibacterium sp. LLYu02]|uniref:sugar transferase n=1 Tax=Arenibacterium sp. LLYu02 TaxID=3404132 RepID=UPI003B21C085
MKQMDHATLMMAGLPDLPDMGLVPQASVRRETSEAGLYGRIFKRVLDLTLLAMSLPIVLPIVAAFALALWLEGGQPFYRQNRLGRNGRVFRILKLRTMVRDAEASLAAHLNADPALRKEWDETQKLKHDPRITPVGHLLRATSLDELPQLWNVLIGDMSLVGPRPMMVTQAALYGRMDDYNALRPGITGLWQVGERNESSFCKRAVFDETYRAELSFGGDLKILLRTIPAVLRGTGY